MQNNENLLKNYKKEKIHVKSEIKTEKNDLFKYRQRSDYAAAEACIEKIGNLNSRLNIIEKEIARLERIIKNNGVDSYAVVPTGNNEINSSSLSVDKGINITTATLTIETEGTRGYGDDKVYIHNVESQTVSQTSHIEGGEVVDQKTTVNNDSLKEIRNTTKSLGETSVKTFNRPGKNYKSQSNSKKSKFTKPKKNNKSSNNSRTRKLNNHNSKEINNNIIDVNVVKTATDKNQDSNVVKTPVNKNLNFKPVKSLKNAYKKDKDSEKSEIHKSMDTEKKNPFYKNRLNNNPNEKSKMNRVLFELKEGKSIEQACNAANISKDVLDQWLINGYRGNIVYTDFYNEYIQIKGEIDFDGNSLDKKEAVRTKFENEVNARFKELSIIENNLKNFKSQLRIIDSFEKKTNSRPFYSKGENDDDYQEKSFTQPVSVSKVNSLISKFENLKLNKIDVFNRNKRTIDSYNDECTNINCYKSKKIQFKKDLDKIDEDIKKAGFKNDFALVKSLQNKKSRINTKLFEIENIIVLMEKQSDLEDEISKLNDKIEDLKQRVKKSKLEKQDMDKFLKAFRKSTCRQAAKQVNIKPQRIVNWLHEGRDNISENKIYFYKEFNKIKDEKARTARGKELRKLKAQKISKILKQLRNGKTKYEACKLVGISINDYNRWYGNGQEGNGKDNIDFYNQVKEINLMNKFLKEFQKNKSVQKTLKRTKISQNQYNRWLNDGDKKLTENAIYFVAELNKMKKEIKPTKPKSSGFSKPTKPKSDGFNSHTKPRKTFYEIQKNKMDNVLSEMRKGMSMIQAAENANIPISTVNKWYNEGKKGNSENYSYFYKKACEISNIDDMKLVIDILKNGKTISQAANALNISIEQIDRWFEDGKNETDQNTVNFYNEMIKIKQNELNEMGRVLDSLNNGDDKFNACKNAGISVSKLDSWLNEGNLGINKNSQYFVNEYNKIDIKDEYIHVNKKKSKRKFCTNCGKEISEKDKFCTYCGYRFDKGTKKPKKSIFDRIRGLF